MEIVYKEGEMSQTVDYFQIIFSWIKLVSYRSQNQKLSKWYNNEYAKPMHFCFDWYLHQITRCSNECVNKQSTLL